MAVVWVYRWRAWGAAGDHDHPFTRARCAARSTATSTRSITRPGFAFTYKAGLSDSALSKQLTTLEDAGYIEILDRHIVHGDAAATDRPPAMNDHPGGVDVINDTCPPVVQGSGEVNI